MGGGADRVEERCEVDGNGSGGIAEIGEIVVEACRSGSPCRGGGRRKLRQRMRRVGWWLLLVDFPRAAPASVLWMDAGGGDGRRGGGRG